MRAKKTSRKNRTKKGKPEKLTDKALENALWGSIQGVANGTMEPEAALAISQSAKEITRIQRLKIDLVKLSVKKFSSVRLIG